VVLGRVHEVRSLDDGQLLAARLAIASTYKGKSDGSTIGVVQMRSSGARPAQFAEGQTVLAFLAPAPRNSYLRQQVGEGEHWQAVDENGGVLGPQAGDAALLGALGEQMAAIARGVSTPESRRRLVFDLLRTRTPVLVADAAETLGEISGLAESLTRDEQKLLEEAIGRDDLLAAARAVLIRAVGAAQLRALLPFLQKLRPKEPAVRSAQWDALAALGAPLPAEELSERIADKDPEIRKIAVRELFQRRGTAAIAEAGRIAATDPDEGVRLAAVELLGATKSPDAIPPLERVYGGESWPVRQVATRALLEIGGEPARQSLLRLVFAPGSVDAQRYAVAALLISGVKFDDPIMQKIQKEHPDESVRELAEHGVHLKEH